MRYETAVQASILMLSVMRVNAGELPADARRGAEVVKSQHCVDCHSIRGQGSHLAPDLGRILGRGYTPVLLAAVMWNHAPSMWRKIAEESLAAPPLGEEQARDLFAYFHSIRAFEKPADAGRGKKVFESKHCSSCHGISSAAPGGGPPVAAWGSLTAPLALAQAMWNHAAGMQARMAAQHLAWPGLTSLELADLIVYLQNLPETRGRAGEFVMPSAGAGAKLFEDKGCAGCHTGRLALEKRPPADTFTDFAVAMWNHAPRMRAYAATVERPVPRLEGDEMAAIAGYLWHERIFAEPGSAARGARVYRGKNCAVCHEGGTEGAPQLDRLLAARTEPIRSHSMVSILWRHGPAMLASMRAKNLKWPQLSEREMGDLIAFLNTRRAPSR